MKDEGGRRKEEGGRRKYEGRIQDVSSFILPPFPPFP
jgi:hypothetical protein